MLTLRSIIFVFILVTGLFVVMTGSASAQGVRITGNGELGSLNGETLYSQNNFGLDLRAVPPTNNQGGTWQWTIAGNFEFVSGTATSRNIVIRWSAASVLSSNFSWLFAAEEAN